MLQRSPIIRFALEVLQHAMESYCNDLPRTRKLAVLHLAQAVELTVKAALVEKNISIYEKDNARTLNPHKALEALAKCWDIERIDGQSRIELLIDERNAIQHRYGSVDDVTLDYHMQTAFDSLELILKREFDTELAAWVRDNVERGIWDRVRFIAGEEDTEQVPSSALAGASPVLQFVDGFSRYERGLRTRFSNRLGEDRFFGSTLDVVLKALSSCPKPDNKLIKQIPEAYRLRNRVVHGDSEASEADVKQALATLDQALSAIEKVSDELLKRALDASLAGKKGTMLPPVDDAED